MTDNIYKEPNDQVFYPLCPPSDKSRAGEAGSGNFHVNLFDINSLTRFYLIVKFFFVIDLGTRSDRQCAIGRGPSQPQTIDGDLSLVAVGQDHRQVAHGIE